MVTPNARRNCAKPDAQRQVGCQIAAADYVSVGLTALGALAARAIPIAGIIVNESPESPVEIEETVENFRRFLPGHGIIAVPRIAPGPHPWTHVPDLTGLLPSHSAKPIIE